MWKPLALAAALVLTSGTVFAQTEKPAEKPADTQTTKPAQKTAAESGKLKVGDAAPQIEVEKFLKGTPVTGYEKGKVYVVEFWATWCGPCIQSMPHISHVQKEYKDRGLTIVGVNVWEDAQGGSYDDTTLASIEKFVADQGDRMSYTVAYDGASKKTDKAFMKAAGRRGIPSCFVVDGTGKVAWIGHPMWLESVLPGVFEGETDYAKLEEKVKEGDKELKAVFSKMQDDPKEALAAWEAFETKHKGAAAAMGDIKVHLYMEAGDFEKLYAHMNKKADEAIKSKDSMALNEIAWTLVSPESQMEKPDLALALKAATKANEFTGNADPAILDTLARVHFVKGDKAKALEVQTRAVEMAKKDTKNSEMVEELEERLAQYKK